MLCDIDAVDADDLVEVPDAALSQQEFLHTAAYLLELDDVVAGLGHRELQGLACGRGDVACAVAVDVGACCQRG